MSRVPLRRQVRGQEQGDLPISSGSPVRAIWDPAGTVRTCSIIVPTRSAWPLRGTDRLRSVRHSAGLANRYQYADGERQGTGRRLGKWGPKTGPLKAFAPS